jgi:hypothetical protein
MGDGGASCAKPTCSKRFVLKNFRGDRGNARASFRTFCNCFVAQVAGRKNVDDGDGDGDIDNDSGLWTSWYLMRVPSADTQLLATSIRL